MKTLLQIIGILMLSYFVKQWLNQINNGYQFLLDEIDEIKTSTARTEEYMNQLLKIGYVRRIEDVNNSDKISNKE